MIESFSKGSWNTETKYSVRWKFCNGNFIKKLMNKIFFKIFQFCFFFKVLKPIYNHNSKSIFQINNHILHSILNPIKKNNFNFRVLALRNLLTQFVLFSTRHLPSLTPRRQWLSRMSGRDTDSLKKTILQLKNFHV